MSRSKPNNQAIKAAIGAVEAVDNSKYVEGIDEAARIIGLSREAIRYMLKSGELVDYGTGERYGRRVFLRSDCEFLSNPKNRKPQGRQEGWRKVKGG